MDKENWIKELRHRINKANGNYFDFIELSVKDAEEILALLEQQDLHSSEK